MSKSWVWIGAGAVVVILGVCVFRRSHRKVSEAPSNILLTIDDPDFHECCLLVGKCINKLSIEDQLYFYSLFKQATLGNCTTEAPSKADVVEFKKWTAWKALVGMNATEARESYIAAAISIPDAISEPWKEWAHNECIKQRSGKGDVDSEFDLDASDDGEYDGTNNGIGVGPSKLMQLLGGIDEENENMEPVDKLCQLISSNRLTEAEAMLKDQPSLAFQRTSSGTSALHWASDTGSVALVEQLLAVGVDVNIRDRDGETALSTAVLSEQANVCKLLIGKGADGDVPEGDSAKERAKFSQNVEVKTLFGF